MQRELTLRANKSNKRIEIDIGETISFELSCAEAKDIGRTILRFAKTMELELKAEQSEEDKNYYKWLQKYGRTEDELLDKSMGETYINQDKTTILNALSVYISQLDKEHKGANGIIKVIFEHDPTHKQENLKYPVSFLQYFIEEK